MRVMRLLVRDWRSGGLIGCLVAVCLQFQAGVGLAVAPAGDSAAIVICTLHGTAALPAGEDDSNPGNGSHDCCSTLCRLVGASHPATTIAFVIPDRQLLPVTRRIVFPAHRPAGFPPKPAARRSPPETDRSWPGLGPAALSSFHGE